MTRAEHLEFCKICQNRTFDSKQGIICSLTGEIANFEESCENFNLDETVQSTPNKEIEELSEEPAIDLDENSIIKLKAHQDFQYAVIGGILAALISAVIWAVITISTKYQIGYMAIGVGFFVGYSVQFFGAGIDKKFGYLGAVLSLLGCAFGNLFSQLGFIAQAQSIGYFEIFTYLDLNLLINIFIESFNPMDILFYGFAIYEGYRFAFRKITASEIENLQSEDYEGLPSNYKLRLPLVIISTILIGIFFLSLTNKVNGAKTFTYESGEKMSEGEFVDSKEHGNWTYWYENGNKQLTAYFTNGSPDSLWQWFDESGKLVKIGHYKKGLEHGVWIGYYENGSMIDSGNYIHGRMQGFWKQWSENGNLIQCGNFDRDNKSGTWKTYYENGQLSSVGEMLEGKPNGLWTAYHSNGKLANKLKYLTEKEVKIENAWDKSGKQIVHNGNGIYKEYSIDEKLILKGNVQEGNKVGIWTQYFENGKVKEEGYYENGNYFIVNSWNINMTQTVKDKQGEYISYYPDGNSTFETGTIKDGLREGLWLAYFQLLGTKMSEQHYVNGELNGMLKTFYDSGVLNSEGLMKNGLQEGEWNWYYQDGSLSSKVNFIEDKKEGKQVMWNPVGEKTKEEYYDKGKLIDEKIL